MKTVLAVAAGGAIGATARFAVDVAWPWPGPGLLPWGTLAINVVGSFALGALAWMLGHRLQHPLARPFLATGVLGGFTTFSAFAVQVVALSERGSAGAAAAYALVSVVACVAAARLGLAVSATREAPGDA